MVSTAVRAANASVESHRTQRTGVIDSDSSVAGNRVTTRRPTAFVEKPVVDYISPIPPTVHAYQNGTRPSPALGEKAGAVWKLS